MEQLATKIAEERKLGGMSLDDFWALVKQSIKTGEVPAVCDFKSKTTPARRAFIALKRELLGRPKITA